MRTLGIDLGTTNTVIALDGNVVPHLAAADSGAIVPSVVAFPPSGAVLVGQHAKRRRPIDAKNTIYSAKRLMGQTWHSYVTARFRHQYPFDLVAKGTSPAFKTRAGTFAPQEIGARIIQQLMRELALAGGGVRAVIAVPVAFDEAARQATIEAGKQADLKLVRVVAEPVATALAYLTVGNTGRKRVAVYDLGGGTFDLAVLDCSKATPVVLAHGGDPYLGGDDIDHTIADWVTEQVMREHGWDLRSDAQVRDRLLVQCEHAKARLGLSGQTRIDLGQVDPAAPMAAESVVLEREVFERLSRELVNRSFIVCDQVLSAAGMSVRDIDAVFLSGGSTLLPMVRDGVARYFGALPRCDLDPMKVVAIGASLAGEFG